MRTSRIITLIARREMRERAASRGYQVSTLITLLVVVAIILLPQLLDGDGPTQLDIGMLGTTDTAIENALAEVASARNAEVDLVAVTDRTEAAAALDDGDLDGVIEDGRRLLVHDAPDALLRDVVAAAIQQTQVLGRLDAAGIPPAEAAAVLTPDPVEVVRLGGRSAEETETSQAIAFFGVVVLFLSVTTSAGALLMGTIEEKTSRVVEVLLGTVRPWHLLAGKLTGLGALALAQFVVVIGTGLGVVLLTGAVDLPPATPGAIALGVLWFLLGYAFFASIYAVAGAMAGSMEDAQYTAGPVGLLLTASYIAVLLVVNQNPEGMASRILTVLPPLAPMAVPARASLAAITWWEVVLAAAVMLAATYGVVRLAGRLYAEGILRTGGRARLGDLWRAEELSAVD